VHGLRWRIAGLVGAVAMLCGCSSGSAAALHVRLHAGPAAAPYDTPVHITVSGLPPGKLVTLQARARDDEGRLWQSAAQFRADSAGTLNLATAVPVSGSYHVADPAGLLWSLEPAFTRNPDTQFYAPSAGFGLTIRVLVGGQLAAVTTLRREQAHPASVQTVRREGFASALFVPARTRHDAPAVVVIGGSAGGEDTLTAGALSMIGYPALALAYFKEPGLPRCLCAISRTCSTPSWPARPAH
jgi:Acyl-CoA thioester hydrolase/BAAT N-terminal region